jgi:hypothetical protein
MSGSASMYSLAGVAVAGVSAAAAATLARRERTYLPRGHASRIDACRNPLGRALRYGCAGVTVGVEVGPDGRLRLATGASATPASGTSATGMSAPGMSAPVAAATGVRSAGVRASPRARPLARTAPDASAPGSASDPSAPGSAPDASAPGSAPDASAPGLRAAAPGPVSAVTEPSASGDVAHAFSRLVLDPLRSRVRVRGLVHAAQHQPFTVVLEPADGVAPARVLDALEGELLDYAEMLTRSVAGTVRHAPVLVALAGARASLSPRESRLFFAEGTLADIERRVPTSVVPLAGEHVAWRLGWDGRGEMPGEERHMLRALIAAAHAEGKRVRLFGVPEKRRAVRHAFWRELHAAGADLIGARDVGSLRRFLRAQRAHADARQVNTR